MATATREIQYPTGDGKPMAETDLHRDEMLDLIETLKHYYANHDDVYVTGNLLLFYEEGNRRKHVAPDTFVVRGIENKKRDHYLVWREGKAPDAIIEITSKSTKREDQHKKRELYRETLRVPEYFLFDPTEDYLDPPLQGFRLVDGNYLPIAPVDGRLPSEVLGLHLERDGQKLRLYDPTTGTRLLTPSERSQQAEDRASDAENRASYAENRASVAEAASREQANEIERLRGEIERLRRDERTE